MRRINYLAAALLALLTLAGAGARAQIGPDATTGLVWTASQWNAFLAAKKDFVPTVAALQALPVTGFVSGQTDLDVDGVTYLWNSGACAVAWCAAATSPGTGSYTIQPIIGTAGAVVTGGNAAYAAPVGVAAVATANGNATGSQITINLPLVSGGPLQNGMRVTAQYVTGTGGGVITFSQCIPTATTIQVSGAVVTLYQKGTPTLVNLACQINNGQKLYFSVSPPQLNAAGGFFIEHDRADTPGDVSNFYGYGPGSQPGTVIQTALTNANSANNLTSGVVSAVIPGTLLRSVFRGDDSVVFAAAGSSASPVGSAGSDATLQVINVKYGDGSAPTISLLGELMGGGTQGYQSGGAIWGTFSNQANSSTALGNLHLAELQGADGLSLSNYAPTILDGYIARLAIYDPQVGLEHAAFVASIINPAGVPGTEILLDNGYLGYVNGWGVGINFGEPKTVPGGSIVTGPRFASGNWVRADNGAYIAAVTDGVGPLHSILPSIGYGGYGCPNPGSWVNVEISVGSPYGTAHTVVGQALLSSFGSVSDVAVTNPGNYGGIPTVDIAGGGCTIAPVLVAYPQTDTQTFGTTAAGLVAIQNIGADTGKTDASLCQVASTGELHFGTGTGGLCLGTSSYRFKRDPRPVDDGLAQILALKPVNYRYKPGYGDGGARLQYGFGAEDVVSVLPKLVGRDAAGAPNSVDMLGLVPVLVKSIQQQQNEIRQLQAARAPARRKPAWRARPHHVGNRKSRAPKA